MLAFAATGEGPFGTGSAPTLAYRVVYSPPSLDSVPADVRPLIESCLDKDPGRRPAAKDLLAGMGTFQPATGWLPEPMTRTFAQQPPAPTALDTAPEYGRTAEAPVAAGPINPRTVTVARLTPPWGQAPVPPPRSAAGHRCAGHRAAGGLGGRRRRPGRFRAPIRRPALRAGRAPASGHRSGHLGAPDVGTGQHAGRDCEHVVACRAAARYVAVRHALGDHVRARVLAEPRPIREPGARPVADAGAGLERITGPELLADCGLGIGVGVGVGVLTPQWVKDWRICWISGGGWVCGWCSRIRTCSRMSSSSRLARSMLNPFLTTIRITSVSVMSAGKV